MAQIQYIGARYVPVWYTNTDDQTSNWQINVEYEPLTFVTTINNHLYISKKTVPDNIGNPADNTEYWLDMGAFTGSFQELQQEIDELTENLGTLDGVVAAVKTVTDKISPDTLIGKQIAVYGDSWADPTNVFSAWVDKLSTYSGNVVHNNSVSGRTFADIDTAFDNYVADVYIVEAGVNDWNSNLNPYDVCNSIGSIIDKIRNVNANAEIIFTTPIANLRHSPSYPGIYSVYPLELYRQVIWHTCIDRHVMVVSGLKMENVKVGDGLHPVVTDAVYIADAIIRSYTAGGDSRDYLNEFVWIDSTETVYCLAESGSFKLVGNKTINFTSGQGSLADNYFNLNRCFLNREQTSLSSDLANDCFIVRTGLNSNGLSFSAARVSNGRYADVNGGLPLHFDIPLNFFGTMSTVSFN